MTAWTPSSASAPFQYGCPCSRSGPTRSTCASLTIMLVDGVRVPFSYAYSVEVAMLAASATCSAVSPRVLRAALIRSPTVLNSLNCFPFPARVIAA